MSKRAYTFAKATSAQMDEQSLISDSQKNGGLLIDVKDLAKASELAAEKTARENADTALGARIDAVKDAFVFNDNTTATAFQTAFSSNKILIYEKVTSQSTNGITRRFNLVKKEQRAGKPTTTLLFACLDGETIYKVSMVYDMVAPSLTIGEITSYAIKDKDDELAQSIVNNKNSADQSFRIIGEGISGISQELEVKLEGVAHDNTLTGDGTEANPLKVRGGAGGGIPEAPEDGKQYARKDGDWSEVVIPSTEWSDIGNKPSTFPPSAHTHTKEQITDLVVPSKTSDLDNDSGFITEDDIPAIPTKVSELDNDENFVKESELPSVPTKVSQLTNDSGFISKATFIANYNVTTFAEISQAVASHYCVKCNVSGYEYELVKADSTKVTFALTNNVNGAIIQETVWVNSDNTWDAESTNVAKSSDIPSVPTKTSELTNDSGFVKVVVSTEAPAEGTPEDTLTAILDGEPKTIPSKFSELYNDTQNKSIKPTFSVSVRDNWIDVSVNEKLKILKISGILNLNSPLTTGSWTTISSQEIDVDETIDISFSTISIGVNSSYEPSGYVNVKVSLSTKVLKIMVYAITNGMYGFNVFATSI